MSILYDTSSRVIVQGITGREGQYHTKGMLASGTQVVGGVTPGKGGQTVEGLPVFDTGERGAHTNRRHRLVHLRPARWRRRRHHGGRRRRHAAGRLHHREHPGATT